MSLDISRNRSYPPCFFPFFLSHKMYRFHILTCITDDSACAPIGCTICSPPIVTVTSFLVSAALIAVVFLYGLSSIGFPDGSVVSIVSMSSEEDDPVVCIDSMSWLTSRCSLSLVQHVHFQSVLSHQGIPSTQTRERTLTLV